MMFAHRNLGLFLTSNHATQSRRPSRARRPLLGVEHCEQRALLSVALIGSSVAGTVNANDGTDFAATTLDAQISYSFGANQSNPESLTADGTKLVYVSDVTGGPNQFGGSNEASEVYSRDSATGQTTLVSVTPNGQPANGDSFDPVISPNGRYVAFLSVASNLTANGNQSLVPNPPAVASLYIRDLATQTTTLLDQTPGGQVSDGFSTSQFVFSPESATLAWIDTSDNLTSASVDPLSLPRAGGESSTYVYTRNLATQTTTLVSMSTTGQASGNFAQYNSTDLVFSPNGQMLVFGSSATDLTNNVPEVASSIQSSLGGSSPENLFLYHFATGTTTLLSVSADGHLGVGGDSSGAVFSPDGNSVAFTSDLTDLTSNGTDFTLPTSLSAWYSNPVPLPNNIYIRNLSTSTTTLVTATPSGLQSSGHAAFPVFSPDGSELAFTSSATDLTSNQLDPTPPPASPGFPSGPAAGWKVSRTTSL